MKKLIAIALLALAGCDDPSPSNPPVSEEPQVVDPDAAECPRADGDPCR